MTSIQPRYQTEETAAVKPRYQAETTAVQPMYQIEGTAVQPRYETETGAAAMAPSYERHAALPALYNGPGDGRLAAAQKTGAVPKYYGCTGQMGPYGPQGMVPHEQRTGSFISYDQGAGALVPNDQATRAFKPYSQNGQQWCDQTDDTYYGQRRLSPHQPDMDSSYSQGSFSQGSQPCSQGSPYDQGNQSYDQSPPYSQGNQSYDQGSQSYDQRNEPYDQSSPYTQGGQSYDQGNQPYDQMYNQGSQPYDQCSPPYDQSCNLVSQPYSQGSRPYSESRPPYDQGSGSPAQWPPYSTPGRSVGGPPSPIGAFSSDPARYGAQPTTEEPLYANDAPPLPPRTHPLQQSRSRSRAGYQFDKVKRQLAILCSVYGLLTGSFGGLSSGPSGLRPAHSFGSLVIRSSFSSRH